LNSVEHRFGALVVETYGLTEASHQIDGWFRTGDAGALDDNGYLGLAGRIKFEMHPRSRWRIHHAKNCLLVNEAKQAVPTREVSGGK
jgi:acyl-CoA synthetase (AMP-forming)/AMP-acid ligase II